MDKIKSQELSTLVDDPIGEMTVPIFKYTWLDRLLRRPRFKTFTLYKCRVCNMGRAGKIANSLPKVNEDIKNMHELTGTAFPLIDDHKDDLIYLLACCIQNTSKPPKKKLIKFLDDNLNAEMLFDNLLICLNQIGLYSFTNAIILIKGLAVNFASDTDAENANTQE